MTIDELNDEPTKEVKPKSTPNLVITRADDDLSDLFGLDEILPDNVFKAYIAGEVHYMTTTDDGRVVRMDDWLPGVY